MKHSIGGNKDEKLYWNGLSHIEDSVAMIITEILDGASKKEIERKTCRRRQAANISAYN